MDFVTVISNIGSLKNEKAKLSKEVEKNERKLSEVIIDSVNFDLKNTEEKILKFMIDNNTEELGIFTNIHKQLEQEYKNDCNKFLIHRTSYDLSILLYSSELHIEIIKDGISQGRLCYWKENKQQFRDRFYIDELPRIEDNAIELVICLKDIFNNFDEILNELKNSLDLKLEYIINKMQNKIASEKENLDKLQAEYEKSNK